ncbi:MAG: hypothetical protein LBU32_23825 [Clostridiales bacterium]|nr:hypothetical protein [Clostridiales bacterium]
MIRGNHDKFLGSQDFDLSCFEWVKDYFELNYKKRKFVLFHYPIYEWNGFFKESVHLYGHVHNSEFVGGRERGTEMLGVNAVNVGVDVNDFYPVSIERILSKCQLKRDRTI